MKKIFLFMTGLLFSIVLDVHAQAIQNFADPMRMRNAIERNVKEMRRSINMPAPDSLKHSIRKKQRAAIWAVYAPINRFNDSLCIEEQDTLMSAVYARRFVQQKANSVDEQIFLDSTVTYQDGNIPKSKTVYSYDSNGREVSKIVYKGDGYGWKPYSKVENAYNANGRSLLSATWYWDDEICWKGSSKYEYDYDENGNRILYAYYSGWDSEINDWRGSQKNEYKYDENGNLVMESYLSGWNNSTHTFNNGNRTEYKYKQNKYKVEGIISVWNSEKKDFGFQYKQEYDYDDNGNRIFEAEYNYDEQTDSWIGVYKYEYAYKYLNGNSYCILSASYEGWNYEKGEWIGYEKQEYDYDAYGNKILSSYSQWNKDTDEWIELRRTENDFEEYSSRQNSFAYFEWDYGINKLIGIEHWTTTYNEYGDIIQHNVFQWDEEVNGWSIADKYDYEFVYNWNGYVTSSTTSHNDNLYAKTEYEYQNSKLQLSISYLWINDAWMVDSKLTRQYDEYGRIIAEQTYIAAEDGSWINETKQEWGYSGNIYYDASLYVSYKWDIKNETWYGVEKYEYIFDSNGNVLSYMQYNGWEPELGWIGDRGYVNVYDEYGRITQYTEYQNWNMKNNCWMDGIKQTNEYDSYGNTLLKITSIWNSNNTIWQETNKEVNDYMKFNNGYYRQTNHEEWNYDLSNEQWIGSYKYEYAYDERGRKTLYARYNGWDSEGDCWKGNYKDEYAYDDNNNQTLYAYYNGWDYTNHAWRGSYKEEYIRVYNDDGYVYQEIRSEWDTSILDWYALYKYENAYIYVNDTIYYNEEDYYVNKRSYQTYTAQYYYMYGEFWYGVSKTEYLYDESMRKAAEVYYNGMISEKDWQCEGKREYEYDVYGNVCKDNYSVYNMYEDSWTIDNTTLYYYTKGINVLDEEEWLILKSVYADLSQRKGWRKQWYDCSNINSAYNWSGVTRSEGHVTSVDISGFKLYGSFPYQLFTLPYLKEINISNNNFAGNLTAEFADSIQANHVSAENITSLYMANNGFEGNAAGFIQYLPSLTTLNLSGNRYVEVNPMLPTTITSLNLGKQKIDKVIELNLSGDVVAEIPEELPNIWLYDHNGQSFSTWRDLILTQGPTNSFSWNGSYFSVLLSQEDGKITLPQVSSYNKLYQGESGDTLNVICNGGSAVGSTLRVKLNFEQGDVNFVNGVDATDLQATILYAFGKYNASPFNYTAANTRKDESINIQDVVCTVNILLGQTPVMNNTPMRASSRGYAETPSDACIYVEDGKVILHSSRPVAAIDLMVSGQVKWNVERFGLQQSVAGNHLVGYSLTGTTLPVGATVIGVVDGDAQIVGVSLSDDQAQTISVSNGKNVATGIWNVNTEDTGNSCIYDLNGRRINNVVNGISIIKKANGAKKIMNK